MINQLNTIVTQYGKQVAIEDYTADTLNQLTYRQLWQQAITIANILQNSGAQSGSRVLLHFPKNADFVIAKIACWMIGATYIPCSITLPEKRKKSILTDSKATFILSDSTHYFQIQSEQAMVVNTLEKQNSQTSNQNVKIVQNNDDDLAYIIFTSGSTGKAKGVLVNHEGLPHVIAQQIQQFSVDNQTRCLWLHDLSFDAAISDIWVALLSGGTLIIPSQKQTKDILMTMDELNIQYVDLPAALLPFMDPQQAPQALKTIIIGGEVCDKKALIAWAKIKDVFVVYGPTETTICSSIIKVDAAKWCYNEIGKPLAHLEYFVVDSSLKKILLGNTGELIIAGKGIANGYLKGEQSFRFIQFEQQKAYRTGDLVKKISEERYEFIGRVDRQFKLNGKLLCPEEIELQLKEYPQINEVFVFKLQNTLCAAFSLLTKKNTSDLESELKNHLSVTLPDWMIPTQFFLYESLPRNSHNKIDPTAILNKVNISAPKEVLLSLLENFTQHSLSSSQLSLHDLGISSLQIVELIYHAKQLGFEVNAEQLYYSNNLMALIKDCPIKPKETSELLPLIEHIPALNLLSQPIHNRKVVNDAILITGATGNLGKQLLKLLAHENRTVYCLVRDKPERIIETQNIKVIIGDICQPNLGLSQELWEMLCNQVSEVYHCAADVSLLKNIQQLFLPNVMGCYHVLQLLMYGQNKKFHYASTLSLVVDSNLKHSPISEENNLSNISHLYGGYAQSKWLAEQLIIRQCKANIFRFGLLTSALSEDIFSQEDWFNKTIQTYPDLDQLSDKSLIDFTPIDFAAQAMLKLSRHTYGEYFHINNPTAINAKMLSNSLNRYSTKYVFTEKDNDPWRLFKMTNTQISNQKTIRLLQCLKLSFPKIDQAYLNQYVDKLLGEVFI